MKLARSDTDKWLTGVAGGIAEALNVDSTIVRIVFAVLGIVSLGTGALVYGALWVILPRPSGGTLAQDGINKAKQWNTDRKDGSARDFEI